MRPIRFFRVSTRLIHDKTIYAWTFNHGTVNDNIDSTVQYFTKWLITTSCLRDVEEVEGNTESMRAAESLKAGKLPTPDGRMHLRNFCIKLLGMLPNANRQVFIVRFFFAAAK